VTVGVETLKFVKFGAPFLTLTCFAAASSANTVISPNITQITVTADVQQRLETFTYTQSEDGVYRRAPTYEEVTTGANGEPTGTGIFPLFETHRDILLDANVWDPTAIPSTVEEVGADFEVVSNGQFTGTWTFDASLLRDFDTETTGAFLGEDRISLGSEGRNLLDGVANANNWFGPNPLPDRLTGKAWLNEGMDNSFVSNFRVVSGGVVVDAGVTTTTDLYAVNNVDVDPYTDEPDYVNDGEVEIGVIDLLVIEATDAPEPTGSEDSNGIYLFLLGPDNWFETADSAALSLDSVESYIVESITYDFAEDGLPRLGSLIDMDDVIPVQIAQFGAADGTSEATPLLPTSVSLDTDDDALSAPSFEFDIGAIDENTTVFIDPEIAVGYVYEVKGEGEFTSFTAPTAAAVPQSGRLAAAALPPSGRLAAAALPRGEGLVYEVQVGGTNGPTFAVEPGGTVSFAALDSDRTTLIVTGIPEDLILDHTNMTNFVTGFTVSGASDSTKISQRAFMTDADAAVVPLPPSLAVALAGLGGLGVMSRRRRRRVAVA